MDIDNMTYGELKQIASIFQQTQQTQPTQPRPHPMIGKWVIIRTYSAGVWFGKLEQKDGNEVILSQARRMWRWWAAEGISLSACAIHGIKRDKSKIVEAVDSVWLEAIEIIPCTSIAIQSIGEAENVKAE